ncbi:MAG: hypothetical protein ACR2F8_03175 [Caulobacteraceae bacterium]
MIRTLRGYGLFAWLGVVSVALLLLFWGRAHSGAQVATFDQITVHRLNVVEPDGKPRVIISARAGFPGLYWEGKEYRHATRDQGGILFFNDDGTEAGGIGFGDRRQGDHYSADALFAFDQYRQDQTVGLSYRDEDGQRAAGLRVWDRPDQSILPAIELSDKMARATTPEEKAAIRAQMSVLAAKWGPSGERLFAGKVQRDAIVRLADARGRARLVLKVDAAGDPSLEFLDAAGKVVKRIDAR